MKRGDIIKLARSTDSIYLERTEAETQALRDADAAAGRWHDDAGEPIIYGVYGGWSLVPEEIEEIEVKVTSLRPKWKAWRKRPKDIAGGVCESLQRDVVFERRGQ